MIDRPPAVHRGPVRGSWEARALAAADALAEVLGEFSPTGPDGVSSAFLVAMSRHANRIDAGRTRVVAAWDAHATWADDGARSGASWLAARTEQSRARAQLDLRVGRALRAMPVTEKLFAHGDLGLDKVRLLVDAATEVPGPFAEHEVFLLGEVPALTVEETARFLRVWKALADPDHGATHTDRLHAKRGLHLSQTFEGMWRLDGLFEPGDGEVVYNAICHVAEQLHRARQATAEAGGEPEPCTPAQRRADAAVELARMALANETDASGQAVPSIIAVIDAARATHPDTPDHDIVGETDAGAPLTAADAHQMACDCTLSRLVHAGAPVPIDLGRTQRLATPAMRRALRVRDRGCTFPGCDRPHAWTEAHHIQWWDNDGPTSLRNLTSLCSHHHHEIHRRRFNLRRTPDDHLEFTRPDGTPLTVPKGKAPPPFPHWPDPGAP